MKIYGLLLLLFVVAVVIGIFGIVSSAGGGNTALTTQVTIPSACGLTLGNTTFNWGSIAAGATSTQDGNLTSVTNGGNAATNVLINCTAMTSGGNSIAASYLHYYNASGKTYAQKTACSATETQDYNSLAGGGVYYSYIDIQAGANAQQAAGSYSGTAWYTSSC
jgi:hypothetical protein